MDFLLSLLAAGVVVAMSVGANTESIGGLYKTVFENFVAEQTLNKFPFKDEFKMEKAEWAGSDTVYNAHVSRNVSPMWVGEDGAFPQATNQGSIKIHIGQRYALADAVQAHRDLEARNTVGSSVLLP